ncbi:MAG TPA: FtsK/SpoIIIE domain-containing protein [Beutenbergiaceae bacterium]|nr:FtsK/SpoIIIE domain-containing protein [Beutenbergiaceae bacterium]
MLASSTGTQVHARLHLAVVAGPDSGWIAALAAEPVVVGRAAAADLTIDDRQLSRRHLRVRCRRGTVAVQDLGSVNGTRWRARRPGTGFPGRWRRRSHRIGRRWRTIAVGDRLHAGRTTLEVRPHPALRTTTLADSPSISDGLGTRMLLPVMMLLGTVPMLLSSGAGRWRVVLAIAMPIVLVTAVVWPMINERIRRGRRPDNDDPDDEPEPEPTGDDPAGAVFAAHQPRRHRRPRWDIGSGDRTGPKPRPDEGGRLPARRARRAARWVRATDGGIRLALVGNPGDARSLARWLTCQMVIGHPAGSVQVGAPRSWTWTALLPQARQPAYRVRVVDLTETASPPPGADGPLLVTGAADLGPDPQATDKQDPQAFDVVLARDVSQVPAWCEQIVEVRPGHDRQVSPAWAAMIATALATAMTAENAVPEAVALTDLVSIAQVTETWAASDGGLSAVLGQDERGAMELDLLRHGPHAVVAGTTGSGKSELLLTWVLSLALRYPPADLAFVLIDYKGGATFSPVAGLPHVVGVLTDLDASATARALSSLRAELRRREELLAAARAANLTEHREHCRAEDRLSRLMVIVDEFRVLADEHPDFLDALVRLAAQGRSLGIHLVLATQRPGGAITADMRANLTVRICLRVLEETDSLDVLGSTAAARLPALPGRAIARTEQSAHFQAAWCGEAEQVADLVQQVASAARALTASQPWRARLRPPWAPPLPAHLDVSELPPPPDEDRSPPTSIADERHGTGLLWLRTDLPDQQRLGVGALHHPGTVLISGPPRSGRSTAAHTLAAQALHEGLATHLLVDDETLAADLAPAPALGTVAAPDDLRRARRLLDLLGAGNRSGEQVLVIDEVDSWCRALDEVTGHGGTEMLTGLVRRSRRLNLTVVLTAAAPAHRWAGHVAEHLVLAPRDPADAVLVGVPRDLAGRGWPPGRGVLLNGGRATLAHVARNGLQVPVHPPSHPPVRILALPEHADAGTRPEDPHRVWLGVGGDDVRWLAAELPHQGTWLIAGNTGSGRSTALNQIAEQLHRHGRRDVVYLDDVDRLTAAELSHATEQLSQGQCALVGTARPEALLNTYHDVAARLRDAPTMLLLSPVSPHLTGTDLRPYFDPSHIRPGRGVLWHGARAEPVQYAAPRG